MAIDERYTTSIPKGYRIYFHDFELSGVGYWRDEINHFVSKGLEDIQITQDPKNPHDSNAIKAGYPAKQFFVFNSFSQIGFVPKDIAAEITKLKCFDLLIPRLRNIWIGDGKGLTVRIDLLGPKEQYKELFDKTK